ncbi:TPA: hypothetical protein DEP21_04740 [Patescibacteria group bacterium]|nr:hypothetical protein [Candidatus Gracilibacteria bacterium]
MNDGDAVTGYRLAEATYTESCDQLKGTLYCINGSLGNAGNTYKYPTCIPHTWKNCTGPTGANHLEWKYLYKADTASYTEDCRTLSKQFQCIDGSFTGSNVDKYTEDSCEDQEWVDCIDIWTNSYNHHLDVIYGYTSSSSNTTQSCQDLKVPLTCYNGTWSGGDQKQLSKDCKDLKIRSCTGVNLLDGQSKYLYAYEVTHYLQTCNQFS